MTTAFEHVVRCSHCPGVVSRDGRLVHDHHTSCSYWTLRCPICWQPLVGMAAAARHPARPELCFKCGDLLEVASHP